MNNALDAKAATSTAKTTFGIAATADGKDNVLTEAQPCHFFATHLATESLEGWQTGFSMSTETGCTKSGAIGFTIHSATGYMKSGAIRWATEYMTLLATGFTKFEATEFMIRRETGGLQNSNPRCCGGSIRSLRRCLRFRLSCVIDSSNVTD